MKYLGVDVGEKRIGLSVTDESGIVVTPLLTLAVKSGFFEEFGKVIESEKPDVVVFGIPRHATTGEEAAEASQIREFAEGVHHEFRVEVAFEDETGTSIEAEKRLKERGVDFTKEKGQVDGEAAAIILESYLKERG